MSVSFHVDGRLRNLHAYARRPELMLYKFRPDPPQSIRVSGGLIIWEPPRELRNVTHYRIYRNDDVTPYTQVEKFQKTHPVFSAARIFISSYNVESDLESKRIPYLTPISGPEVSGEALRDTAFYVSKDPQAGSGIGMQAGETVSAPVKVLEAEAPHSLVLIAASFDDPSIGANMVLEIERSSNERASWSTLLSSPLTIPAGDEGIVFHTAFIEVPTVAYGDLIRMRVVSVGTGAGNGAVVVFYRP